ncbi:hemolysin-type calcium-binding repeat family protein, partial [Vibrio parahaemolyticus AQ3810]
ILVLETTEDA